MTFLKLLLALAFAGAIPAGAQMMSPMHGGMMNYGACPGMQSMMSSAVTPGDRALVQSMMPMHRSMSSMRMSGNTDSDFLRMMIPHHQAAIDMANAELKYGHDARAKALAQRIIAAQQREIGEMRGWLNAK